MNAVSTIKPSPPGPGIDAFHRARSRCLDAFAGAEAAVVMIMARTGESNLTVPLGAKVEALAKLKPDPTYSNNAKKTVDGELEKLRPLLCVRADIVHARMEIVTIDGDVHARFANAAVLWHPYPTFRLLNYRQFGELTATVEAIAAKLRDVASVSRASSPPRPSPGAAGGP
ncbi:hypothetical protein B2G71_18215 [Novosphingobium sp. PC22D]|nr:hypothetical protein B2G71_18215 [Novosphingobium sp. PC22D]